MDNRGYIMALDEATARCDALKAEHDVLQTHNGDLIDELIAHEEATEEYRDKSNHLEAENAKLKAAGRELWESVLLCSGSCTSADEYRELFGGDDE